MGLFKRRRTHVAATMLALSVVMTAVFSSGATAEADAFQLTWMRTDKPVADGQVGRTWMWGPMETAVEVTERYLEAPNGERQVMYFDKSRMEVTNPGGDPNSIWYVTNGLLVQEMVTGEMQMGNNSFDHVGAAHVNVAGDADDPNGPTYAALAAVLSVPLGFPEEVITSRIDRNGTVTDDPGLASYGVTAQEYVIETNHRVASPFWEFMNSQGTVFENGQSVSAPLFENPYYATGYPITEAYWANVKVGGEYRDVLLQCFQRRCLTYTPGNDPGWQVEAGNVGQHYHQWRYGDGGRPLPGDPVAGAALFTSCNVCHAIDGSNGLGPALNGLLGSTVLLSSGETLIADEAYILESIVDPGAKRSAGYAISMPPFQFTEQQLDDLVAYIMSLE
ncbi:hypothetical protein BH24CHL1_BH24CHL1_19340 [soil metagenome]